MNTKIAPDGGPSDTELMHADGHMAEIGVNTLAFILSEFRRLNPNAPADALACGGCLISILGNIAIEAIDGSSRAETFDFFDTLRGMFQRQRDRQQIGAGADSLLALLPGFRTAQLEDLINGR